MADERKGNQSEGESNGNGKKPQYVLKPEGVRRNQTTVKTTTFLILTPT